VDELIQQLVTAMRMLARYVKSDTFTVAEKDVIEQSILSGQVVLTGLSQLNVRTQGMRIEEGDEYLVAFFSEQARIFIDSNIAFINAVELLDE
jgi:hypothetical protein